MIKEFLNRTTGAITKKERRRVVVSILVVVIYVFLQAYVLWAWWHAKFRSVDQVADCNKQFVLCMNGAVDGDRCRTMKKRCEQKKVLPDNND